MVDANELEQAFPNLSQGGYVFTSPADTEYNCIAWALGNVNVWWWWPSEMGFWPDDVPFNDSVESFVALFEKFGYVRCENSEYEDGFEKVSIFAKAGRCKHAARQLANGNWTSKLGRLQDIEHLTAQAVEGELYGAVVVYLRRRRSP